MDEPPAPELLPGLYREVLDAVALLEQRGQRAAATRVRGQAIIAYSKAWNETAARRLRRLRDDARRTAGVHDRPAGTVRRWDVASRHTEGRPA